MGDPYNDGRNGLGNRFEHEGDDFRAYIVGERDKEIEEENKKKEEDAKREEADASYAAHMKEMLRVTGGSSNQGPSPTTSYGSQYTLGEYVAGILALFSFKAPLFTGALIAYGIRAVLAWLGIWMIGGIYIGWISLAAVVILCWVFGGRSVGEYASSGERVGVTLFALLGTVGGLIGVVISELVAPAPPYLIR